MTTKPTLRFRADGSFRILQLTDMHIHHEDSLNDPAIALMETLVDREQPDMVAFTGDIFCSDDKDLLASVWGKLDELLTKRGIPYTVTYGNHESDGEGGRQFLLAEVLKSLPGAIFEAGDPAMGVGNYSVPVLASKGDAPAFFLYSLDSHPCTFRTYRPDGTSFTSEQYTWPEQLEWIEATHNAQRAAYGKAPAVLFHHNPLPEFDLLWMFDGVYGAHSEMVCRAPINSGLFALLYRQTDFCGVFSGHDHSNSFVGEMMGITLGYGRCSGNYPWCLWPKDHADHSDARRQPTDGSEPQKDYFPRGGRVIVLDEASGKIAETYVSLEDGTVEKGEYHPPMYKRFDYYLCGAPGSYGPLEDDE